jgi:flagellar protein FlbD
VIAVTCRNGERRSLDPDAIQRVETRGDTTLVLDDGTRFAIGQSLDELILIVRDHRAAVVSARRRLDGPSPRPGWVPARTRGPVGTPGGRIRD